MKNNIKVSLVIPAHNESGTLDELMERITKTMNSCMKKDEWECLIINDTSTDNTGKMLEELKKKHTNLRPFHHKINKGQTGCFDTGFKNARGDIILTLDGDLEVKPEDLPLFIKKMDDGADIVNGIRASRKHTFSIQFASRMYNILMFLFFKSLFYDAASNYTAFRSKFVKGINLKKNDHRYILPIATRRGAKEMEEVVIQHDRRSSGTSKYKAINKFIFGLFEIVNAWYRITKRKEYDL